MIRFWKITDRLGRIYNLPIDQLGVGVTCDGYHDPVLVLWRKSGAMEHVPLYMVTRVERCPA